MRLIDADDVVTVFTNRLFEMLKTEIPCVTATESKVCLETCYKIARFEVDNIPTAYDVEKVVEELEEIPNEYNCVANEFQRGATSGASWMKKRAIEIVKAGGKNDK